VIHCDYKTIPTRPTRSVYYFTLFLRYLLLYSQICYIFTARGNARIASAVLAIAIPSVCVSVRPSLTRRHCVKMTASSTVQFALSDSKMCLV